LESSFGMACACDPEGCGERHMASGPEGRPSGCLKVRRKRENWLRELGFLNEGALEQRKVVIIFILGSEAAPAHSACM